MGPPRMTRSGKQQYGSANSASISFRSHFLRTLGHVLSLLFHNLLVMLVCSVLATNYNGGLYTGFLIGVGALICPLVSYNVP
jgi:hypothetical protein